MADNFPIPLEWYIPVRFTQQYLQIFRFAWLNSDFSASYRFLCFTLIPLGDKEGRIKTVYAHSPKDMSFDLTYYLEYYPDTEEMHLNFLNDRFKVNSIKIYEETGLSIAVVMELSSPTGRIHTYYGTIGDSFNAQYERIYGISSVKPEDE